MMSTQPEETRSEKMKRLLAANKVRLARNQMISIYQHELGYALRVDQFLDIDQSQQCVGQIYRHVRTKSDKTLATVPEVVEELAKFKQTWQIFADQYVFLHYHVVGWQGESAGGIKLVLKEAWHILEHIQEDIPADILLAGVDLAFGFCVEVEEYNYILNCWHPE